ncbi:hypothetical protein GCK72_018697 [Caenorhabditis remanei]|uniref:G-protein coupled receptors family 1 profile domain-containing protein n=1 Tax=Caenorhabditis remanei TaxID=31234 RepID=A0A6A5GBV4_CAERE|nr:hypothetical protein GCK72_018697 [Caenorhabditis remanei]KAF1752143.1 hypothetical protein GCK72_018697 [Caenorhabditis remanei]
MFIPMKTKLEEFWEQWQKCPLPPSILSIYLNRIVLSTADNMARLSTWLCVLFALVRVVVLQKISDNRFQMISAPGFGWILIFLSFVCSFVISMSFYYKDQISEMGIWTPKPGCESLSITEVYQYKLVASDLYTFGNGVFSILFYLSNGFFTHILPCLLYPVLIFFLSTEVQKSKKIQSVSSINPHQKRNEKTTTLVNVISVFQLFIEICYSVIFILELIFGADTVDFIKYAKVVTKWIFAFNSSTRCFLCVLLSCRYRNTIRRMFGLRDRMTMNKPSTARPSPSLQRSASSILPPCSPKMESSL